MITRTTLFLSSYPALRYTLSFICTYIFTGSIQNSYPLNHINGEPSVAHAHDSGFRYIPDGFDNTNGMITNTLINNY